MIRKFAGKKLAAVMVCAGLAVSAAGCAKEAGLEGNIQLVGSTSMEQMCIGLSEAYMEKEPEVTVTQRSTVLRREWRRSLAAARTSAPHPGI